VPHSLVKTTQHDVTLENYDKIYRTHMIKGAEKESILHLQSNPNYSVYCIQYGHLRCHIAQSVILHIATFFGNVRIFQLRYARVISRKSKSSNFFRLQCVVPGSGCHLAAFLGGTWATLAE